MAKKNSNTLDTFGMMLSNIDPNACKEVLDHSQNLGESAFTIADLRKTTFPLAVLLRLWFIKNNMTWEKFNAMYRTFAMCTQMPANKVNYCRNNLRRALQSDTAGWNNLEHWLNIAGCDIMDVALTIRNPDGTITELRKSEADRILQEEDIRNGICNHDPNDLK